MKNLAYIFISCLLLVGVNGCTDDFEEINTNSDKMYDADLDEIFPGTVKKTLDLIAGENIYWLNAAHYCYHTYIGTPGQRDGIFRDAYSRVLHDLEELDDKYLDKPECTNRRAVILTWKSYIYYMLASCYGPVPMSDAIVKGTEQKYSFKYDDEKTIYSQILRDLEEAGTLYNASTTWSNDLRFLDMVYGSPANGYVVSDIPKWEKFANTFRLQIAMHAQNVLDADTVRYHAQAAMSQPDKLISALDEAVAPSFGTYQEGAGSWYYNRRRTDEVNNIWNEGNFPIISEYLYIYLASYKDPRLPKYASKSNAMAKRYRPDWIASRETVYLFEDTITRPHSCVDPRTITNTDNNHLGCPNYALHQSDGLNQYRRDSLYVEYTTEYLPDEGSNANLPSGWSYAQEQRKTGVNSTNGQPLYSTIRYADNITRNRREYNRSYVASSFISESAKVVMLSWADAALLKAEATLWLGGSDADAKQYYEEGIRASFAQYGITAADTINAYLARPGIAWGTYGHGYANDKQMYRANISGATGGNDGKLEQIYKQRWLADFFNGLEGWNIERRTRAMNFLPFFLQGQSTGIEGVSPTYNYWTERYIYPPAELNKNATAYREGVQKLQAASPYKRSERDGDNVFTTLAFAKKIPDIETANDRFTGYVEVKTNCEYFRHMYGSTLEEIEDYFIKMSGMTLGPEPPKTLPPSNRPNPAWTAWNSIRTAAVSAGLSKSGTFFRVRTLYFWYYTDPTVAP